MHQIDVSVDSFNAARDNEKEYTFSGHQGKDVGYTQYHTAFATYTRDMLLASIQDVMRECADWNRDGCGIGIDGKLLQEMMHHVLWAREKCAMFVGREVCESQNRKESQSRPPFVASYVNSAVL